MISPRHLPLLLLVLAGLLVAAPTAGAQTPDRGLFGIAPAKLLLETRPPRDVRPLQITNTTRLTYDVRIFAAALRQAPDGGLVYDPSAAGRRLGQRTVRLGASRYKMGPGSRRNLAVRWLRTFPGKRVAPMGIVVQGTPRGAKQGSLSSVYRLVGTYLLQLPGGRRDGRFERLTAEQGPKKSLLFSALVSNTGEVYDQPEKGRISITDSSGRTVTRSSFKGDTILPGEQRAFVVTTRKILPAGAYTATATMRFGGARRRIERPFRLVGPNELPTTRLQIVDVKAEGYVGEPARVKIRVRNTGTLTTTATVRARLFEAPAGRRSGRPGASGNVARRLEPGKEATVDVELGELRDVDHEIDATALAGKREFSAQPIALTPRPERSLWSRFKRWVSAHAGWLIALAALLAVVAIAESTRRYRRRLRAGLAASAAPAVAAPPTASATAAPAVAAPPTASATAAVDLNTASIDELFEVPGIGRGAAQRILDWREEYGKFATLADLQRVEGFDAERVAALEPYLRS